MSGDLSALANAMANNEIHANIYTGQGYLPPQEWKSSFSNTPTIGPIMYYAADDIAQQIAGLLPGASVIKKPPTNFAGSIPDANFIQIGGQAINAGDIASMAAPTYNPQISGLTRECGYEHSLATTIPGVPISAECQAQISGSSLVGQIDATNAPNNLGGAANTQFNYQNGQLQWGTHAIDSSTGAPILTTPSVTPATQVASSTPGASVGASNPNSAAGAASGRSVAQLAAP